jgi:hypothetical protein
VAQQPQEPETPSIRETVAYINANTKYGVTLTGTTLTANNEKWQRQMDLLNAASLSATSGDDTNGVTLSCSGMMQCIHSTYKGVPDGSGHTPTEEDVVNIEIQCKNATVAPHVAKALNHLVRLIQQQVAASQPF